MTATHSFIVHESSGVEYRSPRQIALQIAKQHPTVVVGPPTRWLSLSQRALSRRVARPSPLLTTYSPFQLPQRYFARPLTEAYSVRLWREELEQLLGAASPRVVVFDRPSHFRRVGILQETATAYYAHCDYAVNIIGEHDPAVEAEERRMLRSVDVAFAASASLAERFSRDARRVVHLPCGFNPDLFNPEAFERTGGEFLPGPLAALRRPRVLFSGFISGRVDFVGFIRTAREQPQWSFILLGAISPAIRQELTNSGRSPDLLAELLALPNVHHVGSVPLPAVPAIIAGCDVGLVPYCLSAFTRGSSPIKTFEYLAMGKPVAATIAPEDAGASEHVIVMEANASYSRAISDALTRGSGADAVRNRRASVAAHSTSARARAMTDALLPAAC